MTTLLGPDLNFLFGFRFGGAYRTKTVSNATKLLRQSQTSCLMSIVSDLSLFKNSFSCQPPIGKPMLEAKKRFFVLFVLLVAFGLALRADGPDPVTDPTIVLPAFAVTAEIEGYDQEAGWRYCSLPGLEVLGKGWDIDFKDVLRNFLMFRNALDSVCPKTLTSDQLPAIIVFCDDSSSFNKFEFNLKATERSLPRGSFIGGSSLSQGDQAIVLLRTMHDGSATADALETCYIDAILERIENHSSPWLNRGLLKEDLTPRESFFSPL